MEQILKPYKFIPIYKSVLWGGEKIASFKGVGIDDESIGESWEISAVDGSESVVSEGEDKGLTITQLIDKYGASLVGKNNLAKYGNMFPLLVKLLDASKDLSVQVHPGDELAMQLHNCYGKSELWYIIDSEDDTYVYSGLTEPLTPEEYEKKVSDNTIMDIVARHKTSRGDVFYLPAGRIHSICAGNFIYEVQQTSDITYRIYDFDRRDKDGKPRELHTELAKKAIDYNVYDNYVVHPESSGNGELLLASCQWFDVKLISISGSHSVDCSDFDSFIIYTCIGGDIEVTTDECNSVKVKQGETILIPASVAKISISGNGKLIAATV